MLSENSLMISYKRNVGRFFNDATHVLTCGIVFFPRATHGVHIEYQNSNDCCDTPQQHRGKRCTATHDRTRARAPCGRLQAHARWLRLPPCWVPGHTGGTQRKPATPPPPPPTMSQTQKTTRRPRPTAACDQRRQHGHRRCRQRRGQRFAVPRTRISI